MAEVNPQSTNTFSNNNNDDNGANVASLESNRVLVSVGILRRIAFTLSIVTLAVFAAVYTIVAIFPFRQSWATERNSISLIELMIVIIFFHFINTVVVAIPVLLTIIADFVFTWSIISCLIDFMGEFPHYEWCYQWGSEVPVFAKCVQWRLILTILMGIASGFAIILGALFVILILLGLYAIFKSDFWKNASLSVPTGELTWTLSLKFKKTDGENPTGIIQEARSAPTGQGPVHL